MFDYALRKAKELSEQYKVYSLKSGATRKCEKDFLWTCTEFVNKLITIKYLPKGLPSTAMRGTFIRTSDGYDILLLPDLPADLERFVLCKELFHVILDHEMVYNMNLLHHLDSTLFGNFEGGSLPAHVIDEYVTHAAAAEFLFPYEDRKKLIANGRQNDMPKIAQEYEIPLGVVEHYISDRAMEVYEPKS